MLISLFSQVAYAEDRSAFVSGQYETVIGENVEIELKATDSTGVIAMLCEIEFDSDFLDILRYDDAKLIGGTLTAKTDESPMRLFWMDALATENTLVSGTLGRFTFKAKKAGKTEIKVNYVEAYTKDGDLVPFENAVIEVNIKESDTPVVETKEYTIKAIAGANGKINPSGEIKATEGKQLLFIFTPDSGYKVDDVKVDGESVGAVLEYTYDSVNADSKIEVTFEKIRSSGGSSGGSSSSSGATSNKSDEETAQKPTEETTPKEETTIPSQSTTTQQTQNSSGMLWPVSGYSYISSPFGNRISPIYGGLEFHRGIDIPAPSGTAIRASASGTVITACYNSSYGNYVMIAHDNGLVTLYAHAVSLYVSAGQTVQAGDIIAGVGTTGDSTGNHLHFEVRVNGIFQNPVNYVSP